MSRDDLYHAVDECLHCYRLPYGKSNNQGFDRSVTSGDTWRCQSNEFNLAAEQEECTDCNYNLLLLTLIIS